MPLGECDVRWGHGRWIGWIVVGGLLGWTCLIDGPCFRSVCVAQCVRTTGCQGPPCRGCLLLRQQLRAMVEVVDVDVRYRAASRFHPLPTRPVFSPRYGEPPPIVPNSVSTDDSAPIPPGNAPAPVRKSPPASLPEQIDTPTTTLRSAATPDRRASRLPESDHRASRLPESGRVGQAPRRLDMASRSPGWIYSPTMPRKLNPER